ncbi:MAG: flagellar hook-length control protein FliK [Agathobacter sp.]|nr:flagellar hook-length control protein FliK [Agathobacter sp.]
MTGANLINYLQPDVSQATQSIGTTSKKGRNGDEFAIFADFMRQPPVTQQNETLTKTSNKVDESYDEYKYKDNSIEKAQGNPIKDKISDSKEDIEEFEEKVIEAVSEELGVTEEEVKEAMEVLGLGVFDLLEPANLAELTVEVTDNADAIELLTDESFQNLMTGLTELCEELQDTLGVTASQFDEIVSEMTIVEGQELDSQMMDELESMNQISEEEVASTEGLIPEKQAEEALQVENIDILEAKQMQQESSKSDAIDDEKVQADIEVIKSESDIENSQDFSQESNSYNKNNNTTENNLQTNVVVENQVNLNDIPEQVNITSESYLSTDTLEIIQQIVENIRVNTSSEISNMEMQLNPESLGKIYVNISSEEGNISARIIATNDLVKEALESQMLELKENLTQAGIKVDALEVTVATHEFERNLEQDQSRQKNEGERQEEMGARRRNINLSSLDDLSGLMTEEESLVAQMMVDNGNSVDFTA